MKSEKYWKSRAANRMFSYQQQADKVADDIAGAHIKATEQINSEIKAIFRTFQVNGGLSEEEAKKLLNELPDDAKLKSLKEIVQQVKDPKQRQALLSQINSPAYAYRIKRFEQLQKDIDKQTAQLASFEQTATRVHYVDLADEAYHRAIFDIQKGTGIGFSFSRMPTSRIEAILKQNWSGQLFSERIWGRADNLNKSIQQELLAQFMTGRSYKKTAKEIEDRLAVSSMAARRLIRTESTYVANCAEIESYNECGIDKFQFTSTLDMRTSDICQQMDGKEFEVDKAMPGVNLPPLHVFCRSTTIAVIDSAVTDNLKRSARDPETGKNYKVPADMTYSQWKKEYVDKSAESGIIKEKGGVGVRIDKFTPCLEDAKTGKILSTSFSMVSQEELKQLKGWNFNWTDSSIAHTEIYKLTLKDDNEIQGLIALSNLKRSKAVYINLVESAPHNLGYNKKYNGVGGHLYAIAAKKSLDNGFGGFLFMDAKNVELVEHYKDTLGAVLIGRPHPYRMIIDEEAANRLLEIYTLEGE